MMFSASIHPRCLWSPCKYVAQNTASPHPLVSPLEAARPGRVSPVASSIRFSSKRTAARVPLSLTMRSCLATLLDSQTNGSRGAQQWGLSRPPQGGEEKVRGSNARMMGSRGAGQALRNPHKEAGGRVRTGHCRAAAEPLRDDGSVRRGVAGGAARSTQPSQGAWGGGWKEV